MGYDDKGSLTHDPMRIEFTQRTPGWLAGDLPCVQMVRFVGLQLVVVAPHDPRAYPDPASTGVQLEGAPSNAGVMRLYDTGGTLVRQFLGRSRALDVGGLTLGDHLVLVHLPNDRYPTLRLVITDQWKAWVDTGYAYSHRPP